MERMSTQVMRNSIWKIISLVITRIGSLIFTIILARFLMPEGFGIYSLAISVALFFLTFADLGANQTLVNYVSKEIEKNEKKAVAYFRYIFKIKLILISIASLVLLSSSYFLATFVFKKELLIAPLIVFSFYVFFLGLESFFESFFYIKKRVKWISYKEALSQTVRIVLALVLFLFFATSYYIIGLAGIFLIVSLISLFVVLYLVRRLIPSIYKQSDEKIDKKRVFRFLAYLSIGSLSIVFFSHVDTIMLGIFLPAEYVGFYRAAVSIVFGVAGLLSFTSTLLPFFNQLGKGDINKGFNMAFRYMLIMVLPASLGLAAISGHLIRLIFGVEYSAASLPAIFLSLSIIPVFCSEVLSIFFSIKEKTKESAKFMLLTSGLNILLNLLLIAILIRWSFQWATAGTAIATGTSWLFYLFFSLRYLRKEFNFKLEVKPLFAPLISGLIMYFVVSGFIYTFGEINLVTTIAAILIGAVIYPLFLLLFNGLKKEDFLLIKSVFNKRK